MTDDEVKRLETYGYIWYSVNVKFETIE